MKKLGKLNLHNLSQAEIAKKEMNALKGGLSCDCSCMCQCSYSCECKYAGAQEGPNDSFYGGSSVMDNGKANHVNLIKGMTNPLTNSVAGDTTGFFY